MQRLASPLTGIISPYELRLYAIVQSTLLLSLVLSAALAAFSARPRYVFGILALNSTLHLLLDALQTKWANGIHLLAPWSWELINFGCFWPESLPTLLLTLLGLGVFVVAWRRLPGRPVSLSFSRTRGVVTGAILVLVYFTAPLALLTGPADADNHFVATLFDVERRVGRVVEFDRSAFITDDERPRIRTYAGEEISVTGVRPGIPATISARGRFTAPDEVRLERVHVHWPLARDLSSMVGLALVALVWCAPLIRPARSRK